jgi:apolipoprotein N-acyltransferase
MAKERVNSYPQPDRLSFLWLVIGAALTVFIWGNWHLSLVAWLAPLFLIRFMRTQKPLKGFILVVIGLTVASSIAWSGGAGIGVIPTPIFGAVLGLSVGLYLLIDRVLVPRLPSHGFASFAATLVFPLLFTAQEFLIQNKNLYGSNGSWAYSQHGNLVLMQLVSITGLWGLTFLTAWFASTVNWAWERSFSWQEIRRGVAVYGTILILVLAFGSIRLRFFDPQAGTVRVHAFIPLEQDPETSIQPLYDLVRTDTEAFRQKTVSMFDPLLEGTIREAQAGAQIVVWPEGAPTGLQEDIDALIARGQEVARAENIYLAMGPMVLDSEGGMELLRLIIADPSGEIVLNHLKYAYGFGAPLSEVELQTVDTPYGRLSGVLCGDLDIPGIVRQAGRKGVDILLVPAMDGQSVAPWHARMAYFRPVENGFSLVRATAGGVSLATDPYGRVLAYMDSFKADARVMVAQIPVHGVQTVYPVTGDLFGWLTVVGFLVIAGWAVIRGRKAKRAESISSETPGQT